MAIAHNTLVPSAIPPVVLSSKCCSKCKVDKPFSAFNADNHAKLRLRSHCRMCASEAKRKHRAKYPEKLRAAQKRHWADASPEQLERRSLQVVRQNMIHRCSNASDEAYKNYGGRGITVCDRWINSLDAFISDMGPRPTGYQLDRIDNDAGYSPDNCRWVTPSKNCHNKRFGKNSTGVTGVSLRKDGLYSAAMTIKGTQHCKYFRDRWDAICYRKSLEDKFNNTGTL